MTYKSQNQLCSHLMSQHIATPAASHDGGVAVIHVEVHIGLDVVRPSDAACCTVIVEHDDQVCTQLQQGKHKQKWCLLWQGVGNMFTGMQSEHVRSLLCTVRVRTYLTCNSHEQFWCMSVRMHKRVFQNRKAQQCTVYSMLAPLGNKPGSDCLMQRLIQYGECVCVCICCTGSGQAGGGTNLVPQPLNVRHLATGYVLQNLLW